MKEITQQTTIELLNERGVKLEDMAEIVYDLQKKYYPDLTLEFCIENILRVLSKREVQNAVFTGIELDKLAEQSKISEPLLSVILKDESLYGIDEILVMSIVNIYGSIGFTNYGYVDKLKVGIIGKLDKEGKKTKLCHTFLDDLVGAIAAAAASRLAHKLG